MTASFLEDGIRRRLGLTAGQSRLLIRAPDDLAEILRRDAKWCATAADVPEHLHGLGRIDFVQYFTQSLKDVKEKLPALRKLTHPDGCLWIAWPRNARNSDISEGTIRRMAIDLGMIDSNAAPIGEHWQGIKLITPLALRQRSARAV